MISSIGVTFFHDILSGSVTHHSGSFVTYHSGSHPYAWTCVIGPSFMSVFGGMGFTLPWATLFALGSLQAIWVFPVALGVLFLLLMAVVFVPGLRGKYLWRLPAFKEATVSRIASSLTLLMKNGVTLSDAIGLVAQLETSTAATADLQRWQANLADGTTKFSEVAAGNRLIPPLFVWVVSSAGEDLVAGFNRSFTFQPLSVETQSGVALAAGVASLRLAP